jgi:hypothetical protein
MLTENNKQTTAPSTLRGVTLAKINKNNTGKYIPPGKSLQTGIVPVARYSHPLPRLSINCSKMVKR